MKGSIAALAAVSAAIGALGASLWATARPDEGPGRQRTWSGLRTLESIDPGTPVGPGFGIGAGDGQPRALVLITQPGSYFLTTNLDVPAGTDGVEIRAGGVTFDLRGFAIRGAGPSSAAGDGIRVVGPDRANITIRNGSVTRMGGDGVDATFARNATIENINVSACGGTGIVINEGIVRGCNARGNGFGGFQNRGTVIFTDCTAIANFGAGFSITALADSDARERIVPPRNPDARGVVRTGGIYQKCSAANNSGVGFYTGAAASLFDCQAIENGSAGFFISGDSALDRVQASANGGWGIDADVTSIVIRNSSTTASGTGGILIGNFCTVEDSFMREALGPCIQATGDSCVIRDNTLRLFGASPTIRLSTPSSRATVIRNQGSRSAGPFIEAGGSGHVLGPIITSQSGANSLTNPAANIFLGP